MPVELNDWKTSHTPGNDGRSPYLYRPSNDEVVFLNTDNPELEDLGVRIEVLEQNGDGIRVRVER